MPANLPENVPALVRIPFANDITSRYRIEHGPYDPKSHGCYNYRVLFDLGNSSEVELLELVFQHGDPRETVNGVITPVLFAILNHHLKSYQDGPFPTQETALAITHLQEAENFIARRADDRAERKVLGAQKA